MSAAPMIPVISGILAAATQGVAAGAVVAVGAPMRWDADVFCYFWHDGHDRDIAKAGPSVVRRPHIFPIHLCVRAGGEETTEMLLAALDDAISDAFYADRRLSGTCETSQLAQRDGAVRTSMMYVVQNDAEYRHRFFTLTAEEQKVYSFH